MTEPGLVKLVIRLATDPDEWATHETVWGQPLGAGRFEIRNIPWETDELHFLDIVRCRPRDDGAWDVVEVLKSSGHTTLRLTFASGSSSDDRVALIAELQALVGNAERMRDDHWAVDVDPAGDLSAALATIARAERTGVVADSAHT